MRKMLNLCSSQDYSKAHSTCQQAKKEVENGYIDLFLQRSPSRPDIKYEWAWELKYIKAGDIGKLPGIKNQAAKQLQKYKQAALFKDRTDVKFAAIIFVGKDQYEIEECQ
jgi:diketogulonate reductase-like aldo/keto reductase